MLETPRLLLRPFAETDLDDLFAYVREPGVLEPSGKPHCETRADAQALLQHFLRKGERQLALVQKESGRVIGHLSIKDDSEEGRADTRELGAVLGRAYWHSGYMSEAIGAVLDALFAGGIEYVWACCFVTNDRSRRMIERNSFTFMQKGTYFIGYKNETVPTFEYRMTRTEHSARRG